MADTVHVKDFKGNPIVLRLSNQRILYIGIFKNQSKLTFAENGYQFELSSPRRNKKLNISIKSEQNLLYVVIRKCGTKQLQLTVNSPEASSKTYIYTFNPANIYLGEDANDLTKYFGDDFEKRSKRLFKKKKKKIIFVKNIVLTENWYVVSNF